MAEPIVRTPARRAPPSVAAKFASIERARRAVTDLNTHGIDLDDIAIVGAVADRRFSSRRRRRRRHSPAVVFEVPVSPAGAVWLAVFNDAPVAASVLAACEPLDLRVTERLGLPPDGYPSRTALPVPRQDGGADPLDQR